MRTATSRDRGAYDMRHAAMGCAGSSRRAMAPGSSNPDHLRLAICPPHPRSPAAGEGWRWRVAAGVQRRDDGGARRIWSGSKAGRMPTPDMTPACARLPSLTSWPPPDPKLTPHAGDQVGWVGGGGRERRGEDGDE